MGKSSALLNLVAVLFPLALGLSFVVVATLGLFSSTIVAFVASVCGVALLIAAKLPAFRAGRWVAFGPQGLPARSRAVYFAAWSFILVAFLLWVGILPFVRA